MVCCNPPLSVICSTVCLLKRHPSALSRVWADFTIHFYSRCLWPWSPAGPTAKLCPSHHPQRDLRAERGACVQHAWSLSPLSPTSVLCHTAFLRAWFSAPRQCVPCDVFPTLSTGCSAPWLIALQLLQAFRSPAPWPRRAGDTGGPAISVPDGRCAGRAPRRRCSPPRSGAEPRHLGAARETEGSSVSVVSPSYRKPFLIIPGGTAAPERPRGPR